MAFRKINKDVEVIKDYVGGGNKYINTSGMYDIIIKAMIHEKTPNGATQANLWLEHEDQAQMLYRAFPLTNNDGTDNDIGSALFDKLSVVASDGNADEIEDTIQKVLPIGKGGAEKECDVFDDFTDIPVTVRIRLEYAMGKDKYAGQIMENKVIKNIFRYEDKATAMEIINNVDTKGNQYEEETKYADQNEYKDGLTEEDILTWIKNGRNKGKSKEETKKSPTSFGTRRTFGKKD